MAAPSLMVEAFPAVTVPSFLKTVFNSANFSTVEHLVSRFVQETIEEKNRNNYQLCAAYVALVAEVRVDLRKSVDKQALLRDYYLEYKRYPTFVRELEKYGLKR